MDPSCYDGFRGIMQHIDAWLIDWFYGDEGGFQQFYSGGQCNYPCFHGVLLNSTLHYILSKPLAAFPHNHRRNNSQRWERNESCRNDYHSSSERILAEPGDRTKDLLFSCSVRIPNEQCGSATTRTISPSPTVFSKRLVLQTRKRTWLVFCLILNLNCPPREIAAFKVLPSAVSVFYQAWCLIETL